jgi:hypothetical protein
MLALRFCPLGLTLAVAACGSSNAVLPDAGGDASVADDTGAPPIPTGLLQFRVEHNLVDDTCLARGDCSLQFEDETDTAAWLAPIADLSTLPGPARASSMPRGAPRGR